MRDSTVIRVLLPVVLVLAGAGGLIVGSGPSATRAQAPPPAAQGQSPRQGLRAHFYARSDNAVTFDEFSVPTPVKSPRATRIDPQVAFGRGKGFSAEGTKVPPWWEPKDTFAFAAVWKGYVRFPRAGTYYFTLAANDCAAVYLNQARVALSGAFGGAIPSELFSYGDAEGTPGYDPHLKAAESTYVVPVTVQGPRVLPIEVRFAQVNLGGGIGVDLLWVTPDSPRDPKTGKPVAQLVPPEVLFVDPPDPGPGAVAEPKVRAANCMISTDALDLRMNYKDQPVETTLTVRLADRDGRPVPGHRVHVSTLVDRTERDVIIQPEKPTDENGLTTCEVRFASGFSHNARFFATDVTDFVDAAQVAHVRMQAPDRSGPSFFPETSNAYYGGKRFLVEPRPLRVGQRTTVTVPLTNRREDPFELKVRVSLAGFNIGETKWLPVGESEPLLLKPKESREVQVSFTPTEKAGHVCVQVELFGKPVKQKARGEGAGDGPWLRGGSAVSLVALQVPAAVPAPQPTPQPAATPDERPLERRQHNIGPVRQSERDRRKEYWAGVEHRSYVVLALVGLSSGPGAAKKLWNARGGSPGASRLLWVGESKPIGLTVKKALFIARGLAGGIASLGIILSYYHGADPPDANFREVIVPVDLTLGPAPEPPDALGAAFEAYLREELATLSRAHAALVSLERYEGAKLAGEHEAAWRQHAAYLHYLDSARQGYGRTADRIDQLVAAMRAAGIADTRVSEADVRAAQKRLGEAGFDAETQAVLDALGVPEKRLKEVAIPRLRAADPRSASGTLAELMQRQAEAYRAARDGLAPAVGAVAGPSRTGQSPAATFPAGVDRLDRPTLRVLVSLASGVGIADLRPHESELDALADRAAMLDRAYALAMAPFDPPDADYRALVPAAGSPGGSTGGYLEAMRASYARDRGAHQAGDREWSARQRTAARKYAALAARELRTEAARDDETAAALRDKPFAHRAAPERAAARLEQIRSGGLDEESRKLLSQSGFSAEDVEAFRTRLIAGGAEKLGVSLVEMHGHLAQFRRQLAAALEQFGGAGTGAPDVATGESFAVANPRDREASIDLHIRPAAIPTGWRLSLVEAAPPPGTGGGPGPVAAAKPAVEEVEKGRRYRVRLPAKGQIRIASRVEPGGEVGADTTVRWAVEGRLAGELLGGMVHDLHVPAYLPDLELPAPALPAIAAAGTSAGAGAAGAAPPVSIDSSRGTSPLVFVLAGAALLAVVAVLFLLVRRQRARRGV